MISQSSLSNEIYEAIYEAKEIEDREYEEVLEWMTDIIENPDRPKLNYCEICHSKEKLEQHHVKGQKHGNEHITVCYECHKKLTDNQRLWDKSWLDPNAENKDAFLIRGLVDICKLKHEKTGEEIYKLMVEILTGRFSYD